MRQGLNGEGDGLLFIIKINKNYRRRGKTGKLAGLARQGRAGQGRAGQGRAGQGRAGQGRAESAHNRGTYDNELAQDCKHKEIIKGANEEGNEERQVEQINQQSGNKMV